ncbi:MAG TPA: FAD-dependent oxidoreductase, partial [Magnetospirillaceae bacterium]|nr:FAD-dependent oxidoreductase [Magnetospirillaceae bacterium]
MHWRIIGWRSRPRKGRRVGVDMDRKQRIGIVGSGAAGLSLALALEDSGFKAVTVLERESWPGGKCRTLRDGGFNWELGAILGTTDYRATLDLMSRVGMEPWRDGGRKSRSDASFISQGFWPSERIFPGWIRIEELPAGFLEILRYHALSLRYRAAFAPGHAGTPVELADSFQDWVDRRGMRVLAKAIAIPYTTFGYGYYDEAPAAYVLKFFEPGIVRAMALQHKFFKWKEGVQTLWERLAASLDVRYSLDIQEVRRGRTVVVGGLERGTGAPFRLEFDHLVLACPLDDALGFLDASEEERDLYSRILYKDYRVYIKHAQDLRVPAGFAPARFDRSGVGRAMIWDDRMPGSGVHTYYVLGDGTISDALVEEGLDEDIRVLGGEPGETVA